VSTNKDIMTTLQKLHKEITKENRRIELLKRTPELDVDFMRSEIKTAKSKIAELQKDFDKEYEYQNS
jgi:hypothetical protein